RRDLNADFLRAVQLDGLVVEPDIFARSGFAFVDGVVGAGLGELDGNAAFGGLRPPFAEDECLRRAWLGRRLGEGGGRQQNQRCEEDGECFQLSLRLDVASVALISQTETDRAGSVCPNTNSGPLSSQTAIANSCFIVT